MKIEHFTALSEGFEIEGVIHMPLVKEAPCVICSHGLFSSKESPKLIAITEYLAGEGFVAIRYDHRGCNESQGKIEDTTVSGRINDLEAVLQVARRHPSVKGKIGLMGSSMGGYISLFTAARDPGIKSLVVWATPFQLRGKKKDFKEEGYPLLKDGFYEDLARYKLMDVIGGIRHCLVLHGENDELVPLWHAKRNHENLVEPKGLEIFSKGDHRFSDENHRTRAIELSARWFKKYLMNG
ncbi:MAG: alpha/beta fold hydrolase [Deltaproteobacteria bacterium]|nr:alpha/beta fold hydrolase [Deltaproteobacteria bacterium]